MGDIAVYCTRALHVTMGDHMDVTAMIGWYGEKDGLTMPKMVVIHSNQTTSYKYHT